MSNKLVAAILAAAVQSCQCFANGGGNEAFCESGLITDPNECNNLTECHWGPSELSECANQVTEPEPCQCFANGWENEAFCESGRFTDPYSCIKNDRCHWGPDERRECKA